MTTRVFVALLCHIFFRKTIYFRGFDRFHCSLKDWRAQWKVLAFNTLYYNATFNKKRLWRRRKRGMTWAVLTDRSDRLERADPNFGPFPSDFPSTAQTSKPYVLRVNFISLIGPSVNERMRSQRRIERALQNQRRTQNSFTSPWQENAEEKD